MNDDWVETTLGDVADWGAGGTPKAGDPRYYEGGTIPWAVIADVQDAYISDTEKHLTDEGLRTIGHHAPAGAVLVTMYGTIGRAAITTRPMATNQAIAWGIPKPEVVGAEFLFQWMRNYQPQLDALARGATQRNINRAIIRDTAIILPPLAVQRRIVDLMTHVDNHLTNLRAERDAAATSLAALMRELTKARAGWEDTFIGEVTSFAGGYAFPDRYQGKISGDVPFFKVSDMNRSADGKHLVESANYVGFEELKQMKAKSWPVGTVVFPKVGAALLTEKRRVLSVEGAFDNNCMGLIPGPSMMSDFLYARMCGVRLGELAQQGAVPSVNQSHIAAIPIAVPPPEVQVKAVGAIRAMHTLVDTLGREVQRIQFMRENLLHDLVSRSFVISETYDSLLTGVA
jgi:hypothetical protein